mmetsp:Transcript_12507/g.35847  ORF Transcript_12507/g.35847 Transcript_12507/m.35847 type:complete len:219 (+) Transcript_12507:58-714(+)|eukprot:CAMPEP_0176244638 /NCGR_PEP_ID=MMETSP0121_2-20121125/31532_1 /TAXON_ID=160619 /ORGANISM="Kryptoperidinium foliaceum, Strain CCMP 1326" /LENGTH=218 /DNA_ID=CAMNT_0017584247 /DNA_START=51 /DNA_END=707 /DNA_ORIENTATION=-
MTEENVPERYALVLCDVQLDFLNAIPSEARPALVTQLRDLLQAARRANWLVVFSGTRFPSAYEGVHPRHRLFGGLKRLNRKQGDGTVHWLMEGHPGAEIHPELQPVEGEPVVWRSELRPGEGLISALRAKATTKVVLAGVKTASGVLATCEALVDQGLLVYIVRECVADNDQARGEAALQHILPQYADIFAVDTFREQISQEIMMDMYIAFKTAPRAG